ncbi:MAG TPA: cytochrome c [Paracoccaceae bacterium]|nr:cytochrome c [Paracoccaceae bacterium]
MRYALVAGAGLVGAAAAWLAIAGQEQADAPTGSVEIMGRVAGPEMLARGEAVYAGNCASCHGAELEGQPNWKRRLESGRMPAPPHDETGHTWHHSDAALFRLTKEGVAAVIGGDYESDMPAFGDVLTDEEILAVLAFIKSTWPERQRAYQAEITKQDSAEGGS